MNFKLLLRKMFKIMKIQKVFLKFVSNKKLNKNKIKKVSDDEYKKAVNYLRSNYSDCNSSCITNFKRNLNSKYLLDIIIPVYNVEKYVKECIDSVLSQKCKYKFRIIIVDDGSTDLSGKIIDDNYSNIENVLIIHQKNKGLSGARNAGLEKLAAKYVMFIDSDDYIPNDAVNVMLENIIINDADCVQGSYFYFQNEKIISKISFENDSNASIGKLTGFAWGKIYKSNLWDNIIFPEKYWFEDTIIRFLIAFRIKKFVTIKNNIYCYRRNIKSITFISKGNLKNIDTIWCFMKCLEATKILHLKWSQEDIVALMYHIALSFNRLLSLGNSKIIKSQFIVWKKILENDFYDIQYLNDKFALYVLKQIRYNKLSKFELICII